MAELSQRDLLLLSNFAYMLPPTQLEGRRMEDVIAATRNMIKNDPTYEPGGALSRQDALIMLDDMANSPNINSLKIVGHDTSIDAMGFETPSGKGVVAFQGTGGTYEGWKDNLESPIDPDTNYRDAANAFINGKMAGYSDITVTGHSKGGNLAQHVTVLNNDRVNRCVSFDGPGFSPEYQHKYNDEIAKASGKITSINGDNDYVNGMEDSIAGNTFYISGAGNSFVAFHKSSDLYFAGSYDEKGDFSSGCIQKHPSAFGTAANSLSDGLLKMLGFISEDKRNLIINGLGIVISSFLGKKDLSGAKEDILSFFKDLRNAGTLSAWEFSIIVLTIGLVITDILALLAAYVKETAGKTAPKRKSKVPAAKTGSGGRNNNGGISDTGPGQTVYTPETLDAVMQELKRVSEGLSALSGQVRAALHFSGSKLYSYTLKSAVAFIPKYPQVPAVRSRQLSQVIHDYARSVNAYAYAVAQLSVRVDKAKDIFEKTEASLIADIQNQRTL